MEVNWQEKETVLLIELTGKMDTSTPRDFEAQLLNRIANGQTRLVFDFSQVEHITTQGLRLLLRAFKEVASVNGRMVFHSLNDRVRRIFTIAGLTMVFSIYETREEAVSGVLSTGMLPVKTLKYFKPTNQAQ